MSISPTKRTKEKGFTLVELSIVILIIGLLIAGIAAGTQMIRQAELRSIISDFYNFTIAYNNFQTKYKAVPGDMSVASAYFPTTCATTTSTAAGAGCNGDGDGLIKYSATANEVNLAWQHLSLGKVLGANFASVNRTSIVTLVGTNAPSSKRAGVGYILINDSAGGGTATTPNFEADKNVIYAGKQASTDSLFNGALSPDDAFSIDQKMDDAFADNSTANVVFKGIDSGTVRGKNGNDSGTGTAVTANVCYVQPGGGTNPFGYNVGGTGVTGTICRLGVAVN